MLIGLKPHHWHEATFLDRTIDERYRKRLATILLTPDMPKELQAEFETVDPTRTFWPRLFQRMYETSLVALCSGTDQCVIAAGAIRRARAHGWADARVTEATGAHWAHSRAP